MKTLLMYSKYIYSLVLYTVNNKHLYNTNKEINKYRTRYNHSLHLPIVNLSKFNNGAYFSGIKVFNRLPKCIKNLSNDWEVFYNHLKKVFFINIPFIQSKNILIIRKTEKYKSYVFV